MIDTNTIFAMFWVTLVISILSLIGGIAGLYAFFSWRRNRYFLEYVNRKLSTKGGNHHEGN